MVFQQNNPTGAAGRPNNQAPTPNGAFRGGNRPQPSVTFAPLPTTRPSYASTAARGPAIPTQPRVPPQGSAYVPPAFRGQNQAQPQPQAGAPNIQQIQQQFQNMNMGGTTNHPPNPRQVLQNNSFPAPGKITPSFAPLPAVKGSMITQNLHPWHKSQAVLGQSLHPNNDPNTIRKHYSEHNKKWFTNNVCIKSPFTRQTFNKGQVIGVPHHIANMHENAVLSDKEVIWSAVGPVYSKRRMFVILFLYQEGMLCLPLFSWNNTGIAKKAGGVREKEYIQVMDSHWIGDPEYAITSKYYDPLIHVHKLAPGSWLTKETTCHITGGKTIHWSEHISIVGRLTEKSYNQLLRIHQVLARTAQQELSTGWPAEPAGV